MTTEKPDASRGRSPSLSPHVRLARVIVWAARGVVGLVFLLVLLLSGGLLLLRSEAGLEWLRQQTELLASTDDLKLTIGAVEGPLPQRLKVTDLRLADNEGDLLVITAAELRWHPLQLLRRSLMIEAIEIDVLELDRLPPPAVEQPSAAGFRLPSLPRLPLDIGLDRLSVQRAYIGADVAGSAVTVTAGGAAKIERGGSAFAQVRVQRLDGVGGHAVLETRYEPADQALDVLLDVAEPAAGIIAELLDLPGRPPVRVSVSGQGRLDAWAGRIEVSAQDVADSLALVTIEGRDPVVVQLDAEATFERALPPALAPLVRGGVTLTATAGVTEERVTLRSLDVAAAAGKIEAAGEYLVATDAVTGTARVVLGPAALFHGMVPNLEYRQASLEVAVAGALPLPVTQLALSARDVGLAEGGAGNVALHAVVRPIKNSASNDPVPVRFELDFAAADVRSPFPDLDRLLTAPVTLSTAGVMDSTFRRVTVEEVLLTAGPVRLSGRGHMVSADPVVGNAEAQVEVADLAALSGLAGVRLGGSGKIDLTVAATDDGALTGRLVGGLEEFASDEKSLTALAGDRLTFEARVRSVDTSAVEINGEVSGVGAHAVAIARMSRDLDMIDDARLDAVIPDVARWQTVVPDLTGGRATLRVTARGPVRAMSVNLEVDGADVQLAEHRIDRATVAVAAHEVPARPMGTLDLEAHGTAGAFSFISPFSIEDMNRLALPTLAFQYEQALKGTGNVVVPFDGSPIIGRISVTADRLAPIGARWDVPVDGRLQLDIGLADAGGRQGLNVALEASALRYGPAADPIVAVARLTSHLDVVDPAGDRRLSLAAEAVGTTLAGGRLEQTTLAMEGVMDTFAIQARTAGDIQGLTLLETKADIRLEATTEIVIRSLVGEWHGRPLRLSQPARVTREVDRIAIAPVMLTHGQATAELFLTKTSTRVDGRLAVKDVDLSLVERVAPGISLTGTLAAEAVLTGPLTAPRLRIDAQASELGARPEDVRTGRVPPVTAVLVAELTAGKAQARLEVGGVGKKPLSARIEVPVRFGIEPFVLEAMDDGAIDGAVGWQGAIGPVFRLLPVDELIVDGQADIDVEVSGTVTDPRLRGRIALARGRIEVFESGTILRPVELEIEVQDRLIRIARLEAGDGARGRVQGQGYVEMGQTVVTELSLAIRDATLVRRDDVTARVSGTVGFEGTVGERGVLSARISNEATEIRLVDRLPATIPTLPVVFVEELNSDAKRAVAPAAPPQPGWITLDVRVDMPRRVFVRGRGVDSEWGGHARIQGPADRPTVEARLEPIRGDVSLLGKVFVLQSGAIVVEGLDQDPRIDLTAAFARADFKALIIISGTASKPRLKLSSEPELPQDEILARIIFNRQSGQLTPGQAVQLAAAAASLASGEPGVLDRLRDVAGLDRLVIGGGDEEEETIGTVEAGRYVAERVYLGVEQGAAAGTTAVIIEVDITDSIKARSATYDDGRNRVGVRWSWDY